MYKGNVKKGILKMCSLSSFILHISFITLNNEGKNKENRIGDNIQKAFVDQLVCKVASCHKASKT